MTREPAHLPERVLFAIDGELLCYVAAVQLQFPFAAAADHRHLLLLA